MEPLTQGPPLIGILYPPEDNYRGWRVSGALLENYQWVLALTSRLMARNNYVLSEYHIVGHEITQG